MKIQEEYLAALGEAAAAAILRHARVPVQRGGKPLSPQQLRLIQARASARAALLHRELDKQQRVNR